MIIRIVLASLLGAMALRILLVRRNLLGRRPLYDWLQVASLGCFALALLFGKPFFLLALIGTLLLVVSLALMSGFQRTR